MKLTCKVAFAVLLGFAGTNCGERIQATGEQNYPFMATFVGEHPTSLHLFGFNGDDRVSTMPASLTPVTYSPDGTSLYGFNAQKRTGLLQLRLRDMQLTIVPGSLGLPGAFGIAVSSDGDRVILSGTYQVNRSKFCGLFELRPSNGNLRLLVQNTNCISDG